MFLVKSCNKDYNIKKSNTIKIGTLNEYRNTEQAQIADLYEGTFELETLLSNVHIENDIFNSLSSSHNSWMSLRTNSLALIGPSPIFRNTIFLREYRASTIFKNNNRFAFCMSSLERHEESVHIFQDYNDYWYFHEDRVILIAQEINKLLLLKIRELERTGVKVFLGDYNINSLKFHITVQSINYNERKVILNNEYYYKNIKNIKKMLSGILFIKPQQFSKENEVRFLFDFFNAENNILYPALDFVIIDINNNINLLTSSK